jgi:hypothetical protein
MNIENLKNYHLEKIKQSHIQRASQLGRNDLAFKINKTLKNIPNTPMSKFLNKELDKDLIFKAKFSKQYMGDPVMDIDSIRSKNLRREKLTEEEYNALMDYFDRQRLMDLQQNKADLADRNELRKQSYKLVGNHLNNTLKELW